MANKTTIVHINCRAISFVLAMFIVSFLPASAQAGQPAQIHRRLGNIARHRYVSGEVLVLVSADADRNGKLKADEDLQGVEAAVSGKVERRISLFYGRHRRQQVLRVKLPPGKSVKQALAENWGSKDSRILAIEPNYRVHALAMPDDPHFPQMWALNNTGQTAGTPDADIDAPEAWDLTTGSSDVIVAVIDTGIDYLHPDLADNMWINTAEVPDNGIDDDGNGYIDDVHGYDFFQDEHDPNDEHSHGTHCAGTIAGTGDNGLGVTGVNWQCRLMACRFLDEDGYGSIADAIDAINYAVANGADILSNSWGGGSYSATLEAAIINARDNGVLFVAAAGNAGTDNDLTTQYPAGYNVSNVISVAATDHSDALAGFSCYGAQSVHLAAPGVSILSSLPNGAYGWYNGTSMATPHVAGVAALLLADDPELSLQELKSRLVWTGEPVPALEGKTISGRRLNAYNALTAEPCMEILVPNGGQYLVQGFSWQIKWMSIGGGPTVDIYLIKGQSVHTQLAENIPNEGIFAWNISESLPADSDYRIWIDDGLNQDYSDANFVITDELTDYFTEFFSGAPHLFDLSNKSMLLMPDGSGAYWAYIQDITELPADPVGGTQLILDDDDSQAVTLTGQSVFLYGTGYATFYVGSNGYITFGSGDSDYSETLGEHFALKRISCLFRDFDPPDAGTVSWKQLADRAVVTWENVPEYGTSNSSTFQAEMFFDGRIRLSWLVVEAQQGIVGLSQGLGVPIDFQQTNLSEYSELMTPPVYRFWAPTNQRHFYTINETEKNGLLKNYSSVWQYEGIAYYAFATGTEPTLRPIYRFWSGNLKAHFYTIKDTERDKLISKYSHVWNYEGIAFYAYQHGQQPEGAQPVYRFWSGTLGTHFYTMNEAEKNKLINNYPHVWRYEGTVWHAYE